MQPDLITSSSSPSPITITIAALKYEWRMSTRSVAFRIMFAGSFVYGCISGRSGNFGNGAGSAAYQAGQVGWQLISLVAIVWLSMLATRETSARTRAVIFTKPQLSENLCAIKFVGGFLQMMVVLLASFVGSMLFRVVAGTPVSTLVAYLPQFERAAVVILFTSALSYTMALLSDSVVAGCITGLYLVLTMAGKAYLAKYFNPAAIQNAGIYIGLSITLILLAMRIYNRRRRGNDRISPWISSMTVVAISFTIWQFANSIITGHDSHTHLNPQLSLMQSQDTDIGLRAAGYTLPDQNGFNANLSRYSGNIMVIALWSPDDPDSAELLQHLKALQISNADKGVQVLSICLSDDNSAAATFAVGEQLNFPVVTDWGTTAVQEKMSMSPMASAYRVSSLPAVAVTDRRRRVTDIVRGTSTYDGKTLDDDVARQISYEPK